MSHQSPLVAIVGPTAIGKTSLSLHLAAQFQGEIISGDSRQVYRKMDIGTAKPTKSELSQIPHHLIDIIDPDDEYNLAIFLRNARVAIDDVMSRHKLPVVVGGTGQYVEGLVQGWQVPPIPPHPELRDELESQAKEGGLTLLVKELFSLDPDTANRIDLKNPRRVIRAIEVARSSGTLPAPIPPAFNPIIVGLTMDRDELDHRINCRTDAMITQGWVGEVKELLNQGYSLDLSSMSSLGYRELARHLNDGMVLEEAVTEIKRQTRRFARKQYTWFKPTDPRIHWFDVDDNTHTQITTLLADTLNQG